MNKSILHKVKSADLANALLGALRKEYYAPSYGLGFIIRHRLDDWEIILTSEVNDDDWENSIATFCLGFERCWELTHASV